jgi:hypothetical protein
MPRRDINDWNDDLDTGQDDRHATGRYEGYTVEYPPDDVMDALTTVSRALASLTPETRHRVLTVVAGVYRLRVVDDRG